MIVIMDKIEVESGCKVDGVLIEFIVTCDGTKIGSICRFPNNIWLLKLMADVWIYEKCSNEIWKQFHNHTNSYVRFVC